jgi:hypothetical protein
MAGQDAQGMEWMNGFRHLGKKGLFKFFPFVKTVFFPPLRGRQDFFEALV